jgi:chromosome segregation ATPase
MRSIIANALAILLTLATGSVCAATDTEHKQFRWKDASGNLHYSDTLTTDALQAGYEVVNDKGLVIKHVDRAMTDEERKAQEATTAAAAVAKREAEQQAETDRRLLSAYPTEKDFVRARQAQIEGIEQSIATANNNLNKQEQELSDNLARAAAIEHNNKKVPPFMKDQIETLRKSVESLRGYIQRRQKEEVEAKRKFETDLAHYRELRDATPPNSP